MTTNEPPSKGPTRPRAWRPGPRFILAAVFGIALVVVWMVLLASGPSNSVEPMPRVPMSPGR